MKEKGKENKQYRVLKRIWHGRDKCYYDPGVKVSLDHLDEKDIERLIEGGVVKETGTKGKARPASKPKAEESPKAEQKPELGEAN